ncbi:hypothetical protein [Lichenihabitans sp. Uapishka_5]|uniref:hypothetical protein n=1 Tax=Lichenihabitans sp. Uapishka_5 TaxID=3037302 RepID=UPI003FA58D0E
MALFLSSSIHMAQSPASSARRLERNDEKAVQRDRYVTLDTTSGLSNDHLVDLPSWHRDPGSADDPGSLHQLN